MKEKFEKDEQKGLLKRTSRGRVVTDKTYEHLGIKKDFGIIKVGFDKTDEIL